MMNCKELVDLLEDYCDGTMDERLRRDLEEHIRLCEPCMSFRNTYRVTRSLMRRPIRPSDIPEEMRARLKSFIMEKARSYHDRAAAERRRQLRIFLELHRDGKLSREVADRLASHRQNCPACASFLSSLLPGAEIPEWSDAVEEHLSDFIDALPPGTVPLGAET